MKDLTTVEYADSYIYSKLNAETWTSADLITKTALIREASLQIYSIQGFKFNSDVIEALKEIPEDLQQACCEVALTISQLGADNPHIINQNLGIKSISFGQDSASYDETVNNAIMPSYIFNAYARAILNKYIIKGFKYV